MNSREKLTKAQIEALRAFADLCSRRGYAIFPEGPARDFLRKRGLIERWNPALKATGRIKPWRITDAGRSALQDQGEGR